MRSSSVNFLSTVSDDDGYSDSASSSPLSSVSQNSVSHNAVSRVCRLTGRGLSKITFLGNAVLLSSVLSNIIESANAESNNGQNWEVLKSKLCALIFMESSIDKTFEASFHSVDARSEIRSILGEDKLSRNSTSDSELSTILMRVGNKYRSMISDFTGKVFEAEKAGLDVSRNSYRNVYWVNDAKVADTRICPYLHEFFDDMVPESTSISATTTTAATEMPVIATTGSTCMSNTSTALIFMLMMSLVALVFFLLGYKCSSS
ncbi:hypothetical protein, partial [Candidatus Ichthyocystis hellenicum]|uniref:hypothetical protein n=1 Tax=Candidatus Ichthyocystis hellenicum TaxID=1561003 RepID=UPI001111A765